MPRFRQTSEILKLMSNKEHIRNVGVIAHIDHGKTTLTDSLLVEAGLLSPQIAGVARALDYLEEEQKRGITIKIANLSFLHEAGDGSYVVNFVDTPGHVDFTGKVAAALRSIDGAVVVVDAVEELMAQTETVVRQALAERVRPVLFINKVDRLITELQLSSTEIQNKFVRIINNFNDLIDAYGESPFKDRWRINPSKKSVAFGSALHKWGFTVDASAERKTGLVKNVISVYKNRKYEPLSKLLPLHTAILEMIVKNVPSPVESQRYRIPKIWRGDVNSEVGRAMLNCDDRGPTAICATAVQQTPDKCLIVTGRVFSGSVKEGDQLYVVGEHRQFDIKQVAMYMGAFREPVNSISAGNIAALIGEETTKTGETLADIKHKDMVPFEPVKYVLEPVMTVAIEPKNPNDLPRLIEAMRMVSTEDPAIVPVADRETGQYTLSGSGELQLEIAVKSLRQYSGITDLTASKPIATYRESISKQGALVVSKSTNKFNTFRLQVGQGGDEFAEQRKIEPPRELENAWVVDENQNTLFDLTKDVENLAEVKEAIISGFDWACKTGPLCEEPLRGVAVQLIDAHLDIEPQRREPSQIARAVSRAILGSCLTAGPVLLEPRYSIELSVQSRWFGRCAHVITRRRGKIRTVTQKGILTTITGYIPVAETFGLPAEMRSATSGHAFWQLTFECWTRLPEKLALQTISELRARKGLPPETAKPETFVDEILR